MLRREYYITIIVDPGTEYEQEIYYDGNNGESYTLQEALTILDRLDKRQRYVENFFKTSVQFHFQQVGFPARPRANPARIPRQMVDWSRMRLVPPPPPEDPLIEAGELGDLKGPFTSFDEDESESSYEDDNEPIELKDSDGNIFFVTAEDLRNIKLVDPEDDDSPI